MERVRVHAQHYWLSTLMGSQQMTVTQQQIGERVRVARERFHLSQQELSEFTDLSVEDIAAIEGGERPIGAREMGRLAYAVGRKTWEFTEDRFVDDGALSALFRAGPTRIDKSQLSCSLQEGIAYALQFALLEQQVGAERRNLLREAVDLPEPGDVGEAIEQGEAVAAAERIRLNVGDQRLERLPHLFETQGVGSVAVELPEHVCGMTLFDARFGAFILFNAQHARTRRRFALAHEYGHVLMDRHRLASLSTMGSVDDLVEVRANAFAAALLMPAAGVQDTLDMDRVGARIEGGGKPVGMLDIAAVAQAFDVSRRSALRRARQLGLVGDPEYQTLLAAELRGDGAPYSTMLGLFNAPDGDSRRECRGRMVGLALEAFRLNQISRRKLIGIAGAIGVDGETVERIVDVLGLE